MISVHKSKQVVNLETYLKECINKRLLPKYHYNGNYLFWSDLVKVHYSNIFQEHLTEKNLLFVSGVDNSPNVPQAVPNETIWTVLERKIYENNCEAKIFIIWLKESNKKQKNLSKKCCKAG